MDTISYLVVWTKKSGLTVTSESLTKEQALTQFDAMRNIQEACCQGRGRLRVMRESDYRAPRPTTYRGEAAKPLAPVHHGDRVMVTACGLAQDELPFTDNLTLLLSRVTCLGCLNALAGRS